MPMQPGQSQNLPGEKERQQEQSILAKINLLNGPANHSANSRPLKNKTGKHQANNKATSLTSLAN